MADVKHTPGPWVVTPLHATVRAPRTGRGVFKDYYLPNAIIAHIPDYAERKANAHLIAAAPDLLEAAEEFVRKVECGEARSKRSYAQMKAAIAKAKGEQS